MASKSEKSTKPPQRLPPPSLFQGPPSRNASNTSLPTALLPGAHASAIGAPGSSQPPPLLRNRSSPHSVPLDTSATHSQINRPPRPQLRNEADAADLLWEEMQNTLAEVELSAVNGEHVFGSDHSQAVQDLREKQLALAQAWAGSETGEVIEHQNAEEISAGVKGSTGAGSGSAEPAKAEEYHSKALDEESEKDILLARKRREANDRYFGRVNSGVLDVVAKLEEVALAMKVVEEETKDIWSESNSSIAAGPTDD
ncbi:hypothetical protein FQN54_002116 [Arachnomyces sp. PD_36]|nr:hypothetical protein FQN54_002116 [Arachnomyces sp. PD_36]